MLRIDAWISFYSALIPAVMRGDKTLTSRVMRPQPELFCTEFSHLEIIDDILYAIFTDGTMVRCPYGKPRDILGVREGYRIVHDIPRGRYITGEYLADFARFEVELSKPERDKWTARKFPYRDTPGRFMYRSLCRTRLLNKGVRVERLQDIDAIGAMHEGTLVWWKQITEGGFSPIDDGIRPYNYDRALIGKFRSLWDKINKKNGHGWDVNDYVWRVAFEVIE